MCAEQVLPETYLQAKLKPSSEFKSPKVQILNQIKVFLILKHQNLHPPPPNMDFLHQ